MNDLVDRYARLLAEGSGVQMRSLLSDAAVFVSPFSAWTTRDDVTAVYGARVVAVASVTVTGVVADGRGRAIVLWHGETRGRPVEACEVLTCSNDRIDRVDLFLRPADALPDVLAAMRAAWPAPTEA